MIIREQKPYKEHISSTIDKLPNINQWRRLFLIETLILFMSIRGRINFLQLARYGKHKEQRYRQQFEKPFDFLSFNKEFTLSQGSGRYAIAFDPSYVSKSGKKTPGVGWYWSGCANRAKWGLEIGGLAAIDIDNHTAFHLEAVQTLNSDDQSLSDWYAGVISERKDTLTSISKYMVAEAWFSKRSFADQVIQSDMHLISRLRDDADLRYLCKELSIGKRGRPRKYTGKIIINDIDKDCFRFISGNEEKRYLQLRSILKPSNGISCWFTSHTSKPVEKIPTSFTSVLMWIWSQRMYNNIITAVFRSSSFIGMENNTPD